MTTEIQTDRLNFDHPSFKNRTIELHLAGSAFEGKFTRKFGKKIKAIGGSYDACRGSNSTRYVHLPYTAEGREMAEKIVVPEAHCYCVIFRNSINFTGLPTVISRKVFVGRRLTSARKRNDPYTFAEAEAECIANLRAYRKNEAESFEYLNGVFAGENPYVEPVPAYLPELFRTEKGNILRVKKDGEGLHQITRAYWTGTTQADVAMIDGYYVAWKPDHEKNGQGGRFAGTWAAFDKNDKFVEAVARANAHGNFIDDVSLLKDKHARLLNEIKIAKNLDQVKAFIKE